MGVLGFRGMTELLSSSAGLRKKILETPCTSPQHDAHVDGVEGTPSHHLGVPAEDVEDGTCA